MQLHMWCKRVNAWWLLTKLLDMRYDVRVDSVQKMIVEEAINLVIVDDLWQSMVNA